MKLWHIAEYFTASALGCACAAGIILIMEDHVGSGIFLFTISLIAGILKVIEFWGK
jgi:hypothetical protein